MLTILGTIYSPHDRTNPYQSHLLYSWDSHSFDTLIATNMLGPDNVEAGIFVEDEKRILLPTCRSVEAELSSQSQPRRRTRIIYTVAGAIAVLSLLSVAFLACTSHGRNLYHFYPHSGASTTFDSSRACDEGIKSSPHREMTAAVLPTINTDILRKPCGETPDQARAAGCVFDIVSTCWLHPRCHDPELAMEFVATVPMKWYLDGDGTRELPLSEMMTGDHHLPWIVGEYHLQHCAFLWKKMHRAILSGK